MTLVWFKYPIMRFKYLDMSSLQSPPTRAPVNDIKLEVKNQPKSVSPMTEEPTTSAPGPTMRLRGGCEVRYSRGAPIPMLIHT